MRGIHKRAKIAVIKKALGGITSASTVFNLLMALRRWFIKKH